MFSRRGLIATLTYASVVRPRAGRADSSRDITQQQVTKWIADHKPDGYFDPPAAREDQKGTLVLPPDDARVISALRFLNSVPTNLPPMATAKWMLDNIDQAEVNAMEWPPDTPDHRKPANPTIIAFFAATAQQPTQGDQTAWCAAFMNWVLMRGGYARTNSAASASFRGKWQSTDTPEPGDLACFVKTADPRFGHICFFDGWTDSSKKTSFNAIGGNQASRLGRDPFPTGGGELALHSYIKTASIPRVAS